MTNTLRSSEGPKIESFADRRARRRRNVGYAALGMGSIVGVTLVAPHAVSAMTGGPERQTHKGGVVTIELGKDKAVEDQEAIIGRTVATLESQLADETLQILPGSEAGSDTYSETVQTNSGETELRVTNVMMGPSDPETGARVLAIDTGVTEEMPGDTPDQRRGGFVTSYEAITLGASDLEAKALLKKGRLNVGRVADFLQYMVAYNDVDSRDMTDGVTRPMRFDDNRSQTVHLRYEGGKVVVKREISKLDASTEAVPTTPNKAKADYGKIVRLGHPDNDVND